MPLQLYLVRICFTDFYYNTNKYQVYDALISIAISIYSFVGIKGLIALVILIFAKRKLRISNKIRFTIFNMIYEAAY